MECPNNCGALRQTEYKSASIDVCPKCAGVWVPYGQLRTILSNDEPDWSSKLESRVMRRLQSYNTVPLGEFRNLSCPECGTTLTEVNYQGTSNIIVNPCLEAHGLWLDKGELLTIRIFLNHWAQFAEEHASDIEKTLDTIDLAHRQIREHIIAKVPGPYEELKSMVFEVLEVLDSMDDSGR